LKIYLKLLSIVLIRLVRHQSMIMPLHMA